MDLLPRAQGRGYGRQVLERVLDVLRRRGSPGAHLGVSALNTRAFGFYQHVGFQELICAGSGSDAVIYMGRALSRDRRAT
jgi:ribosomal protein S18 acetylase RimI-like enzyme